MSSRQLLCGKVGRPSAFSRTNSPRGANPSLGATGRCRASRCAERTRNNRPIRQFCYGLGGGIRAEILAPRVGFEPTTIRLTVGRSTTELPRNRLACKAMRLLAESFRPGQRLAPVPPPRAAPALPQSRTIIKGFRPAQAPSRHPRLRAGTCVYRSHQTFPRLGHFWARPSSSRMRLTSRPSGRSISTRMRPCGSLRPLGRRR